MLEWRWIGSKAGAGVELEWEEAAAVERGAEDRLEISRKSISGKSGGMREIRRRWDSGRFEAALAGRKR